MDKNLRNSIIVIIVVIILFLLIWILYDKTKLKPVDGNITDTNLVDENTGLDNVINELFDNVVVNNIEENKVEENTTYVEKQEENVQEEEEEETKNENVQANISSVTSKEEKAVELVKQEWGSTSGVYFSNMGIDNEGRYIVSVNNSGSTKTLAFYVVDVEKEVVTKK